MTSQKVCDVTESAEGIIGQIADAPSIFADLFYRALDTLPKVDEVLDKGRKGDECSGDRYWVRHR
ncbi:hypothetical protein C8R44DRAFT_761745 [Mycena epipterygia]|nr:hypothetical protein C8R44DRAFT_761745 [Mycena epipterygia]